jgi:hypothetical protein
MNSMPRLYLPYMRISGLGSYVRGAKQNRHRIGIRQDRVPLVKFYSSLRRASKIAIKMANMGHSYPILVADWNNSVETWRNYACMHLKYGRNKNLHEADIVRQSVRVKEFVVINSVRRTTGHCGAWVIPFFSRRLEQFVGRNLLRSCARVFCGKGTGNVPVFSEQMIVLLQNQSFRFVLTTRSSLSDHFWSRQFLLNISGSRDTDRLNACDKKDE